MPVITDVTLCTISYGQKQVREVRALYTALLELGVTFIQLPLSTVSFIGNGLVRERTILVVPADDEAPDGFAGYVCEKPVEKGHSICEMRMVDEMPVWADEVRVTANASLFMRDYHAEFSGLLTKPNVTFCAKDAGQAGTALTAEWLLSGGERTVLSFLGLGGYAPLEQVLAALFAAGCRDFNMSALSAIADAWETLAQQRIPNYCPVVGRRIFDVESGTHVDGVLKNNRCYEPFAPEDVGAQRHIAIGKHSGKAALAYKLKELGIVHSCNLDRLLELVRESSMEKGRSLSDGEFAALAERAGGEDAA